MRVPPYVCALVASLAVTSPGYAHGLLIDAKRFDETVRVTASFETDDPADDCVVTVTSADGRTVATGKTDAKGVFSFPTPPAGVYNVVADAGAGHRATTMLTIAAGAEPTDAPPNPTEPTSRWLGVSAGLLAIAVGTVFGKRWTSRKRTANP